jgi:dolichol-phosphate mannosyltransferase
VSFSYVPIRAMSYIGLTMAALGFIYAAGVAAGRALGWVVAGTGFAALMTVLLVGQGLILTVLGVLGEYLWRTFDEARGRPRYIVEDAIRSRQGAADRGALHESHRPGINVSSGRVS